MKYFVAVLFLALGTWFFQFRYLAPDAGINAKSTDYSNHISIEQHLKEGILFPELEKHEKGTHAVSRYLPVYHGLLGFHLSAWVLESIGIPLPGAYLLLMDLSLAICLFVFGFLLLQEMKKEIRWEYLLAFFAVAIFLSNFARGVEAAFFSQIMSYALVLLSWFLRTQQKKKLSLAILAFAVLTYPDFLVWFLPFLILSKEIRIPVIFKIVAGGLWLGLIVVLFSRRNLVGPEGVSLYPLFFLPLLLIFFWSYLRRESKNYLLMLLSYTVVIVGFLFVSQKHFTWSYYALKLTYPAVIFLIYAFLKLRLLQDTRGRALVAFYLFFFWSFSDVSFEAIAGYMGRSKLLNNNYYANMIETKKIVDDLKEGCKPTNTLVLPAAVNLYSETGMLDLWAKNSLMLNTDISTGAFKVSSFQRFYASLAEHEDTSGGSKVFAVLPKLMPFSQDICIVSPVSERSLFNDNPCFVILKEQGGQIYAKCTANSQL